MINLILTDFSPKDHYQRSQHKFSEVQGNNLMRSHPQRVLAVVAPSLPPIGGLCSLQEFKRSSLLIVAKPTQPSRPPPDKNTLPADFYVTRQGNR